MAIYICNTPKVMDSDLQCGMIFLCIVMFFVSEISASGNEICKSVESSWKFTELAAMLPENNKHIQKKVKKIRVEKVHLQNYVITQNTTTYLEIRKKSWYTPSKVVQGSTCALYELWGPIKICTPWSLIHTRRFSSEEQGSTGSWKSSR